MTKKIMPQFLSTRGVIAEDAKHIFADTADILPLLSGKKLLLTGASGFLGGYFLDIFSFLNNEVLEQPLHVIAADNLRACDASRAEHLKKDKNFSFLHHDVTQPLEAMGALDYIIHAASIASPIFYRQYPLETIDVNVNGTWRMLEMAAAQKVKSILYFSSSEIYGNPPPDAIPTPEIFWGNVSCTGPRACYDESKRLAETLCATFYEKYAVPVKIIRPFNVYGPGQRLDDQRIIPDLISSVLTKECITLYSDGTPTRSFCYISDFISASLLVLLSDANGEAFNVGNAEEVSMKQAAVIAANLRGGSPLPICFQKSGDTNYLKDNPDRRCPDLSKIHSRFNWKAKTSLQQGLERTLRSYGQGA